MFVRFLHSMEHCPKYCVHVRICRLLLRDILREKGSVRSAKQATQYKDNVGGEWDVVRPMNCDWSAHILITSGALRLASRESSLVSAV